MTKSSQSAADDRIIIGKIGGAHGVRGEFRVTPLTDFPDRFDDLKTVQIDSKNFEIESRRKSGKFIILKFRDIDNRESAQKLTGKYLRVDRSEFPEIDGYKIPDTQSQDPTDDRIIIGKIGAAHGVRGEFRVTPLTDFPDRFDDLKTVQIDSKTFEIESRRKNGKFIILKFRDIDDRDAAQRLNGKYLRVDRSQVPPIEEGEFYVFDLIGLPVLDENRETIGIVEGVIKGYSNDNLSVRGEDGREILIPLVKASILSIDLEKGEICASIS